MRRWVVSIFTPERLVSELVSVGFSIVFFWVLTAVKALPLSAAIPLGAAFAFFLSAALIERRERLRRAATPPRTPALSDRPSGSAAIRMVSGSDNVVEDNLAIGYDQAFVDEGGQRNQWSRNVARQTPKLTVTGVESRLTHLATVPPNKPEVTTKRHKRPPRGWAAGVQNESPFHAVDVEYVIYKTDGTRRTGSVPLLAGTRDEMGRDREPPEAVTEMGDMPDGFTNWWQELDHITVQFSDAEREARWERRYDVGEGGTMTLAYELRIAI